MAKKKTSKSSAKKNDSYAAELWGVLLILIAIMGCGKFGPVGNVICGFAIFLMGVWYILALLACLIVGVYMIVKRKLPKFFTIRLIGIYMIILALLVYSHLEYAIQGGLNGKEIIETTINNFLDAGIINYTANSGGGIISLQAGSQRGPTDSQVLQSVADALTHPPERDSKILLLNIL